MKAFRLNRDGVLEKIEPVKELPIGTKIYAFGAGMSDQYFCITGPMTNRGQEICLVSNWYPDSYFPTPRQYFDKHSRPLSKKFGIGFYWDDVENVVYPQSKVEAAKRRADIIERKIAKMKEEQRLADEKELMELPGLFPHLTPLSEGCDRYKVLRSNILAELKHKFPHTKFRIKKEHHGCIYLYWTDGPTKEMVQDVERKFTDHTTDYTGDFRDYDPSNFNQVFGGINYIFPEREMSEEVTSLSAEIEKDLEIKYYEARNILRQIWWDVEIPSNATNLRLEKKEHAWKNEDRFKLLFDLKVIETPVLNAHKGDIQIITYSPKSFAVIGYTKPLKNTLKELGGSFNFRLSCGAGWIFPNTKKEAVVSTLGL